MGVPKIRGTFLEVTIIRTMVYWGLFKGSLNWGYYQIRMTVGCRWQCGRSQF